MIMLNAGVKTMNLKELYNNVNPNFAEKEFGKKIISMTDAAVINKEYDTIKHIISLYVDMNDDGRLNQVEYNSKEHIILVAAGRIYDWEMGNVRVGEYIPMAKWSRLIANNTIELVNI